MRQAVLFACGVDLPHRRQGRARFSRPLSGSRPTAALPRHPAACPCRSKRRALHEVGRGSERRLSRRPSPSPQQGGVTDVANGDAICPAPPSPGRVEDAIGDLAAYEWRPYLRGKDGRVRPAVGVAAVFEQSSRHAFRKRNVAPPVARLQPASLAPVELLADANVRALAELDVLRQCPLRPAPCPHEVFVFTRWVRVRPLWPTYRTLILWVEAQRLRVLTM